MKTRLNLTIDPEVISKAKRLAARQKKSLSELVEDLLRSIPDKDEEPLFMKMVREAKKSAYLTDDLDIKKEFEQEIRRK